MALGFCPALLTTINEVAGQNSPNKKMHIAGFMAALFCCQNSTVNAVNSQFEGAHLRPLTVKYRKRPTASSVQDVDNCDVNRIPAYAEWNLPNLGFKSTSFFLDDATLQNFCADASIQRAVGVPPTMVMNEVYDLILEHANILMSEINKDLMVDMGTQFGDNVTTGSSTGKVINISRDGDKYILDNGVVDMMRDVQENRICGDPCLIGGGLFAAFNIAQTMTCCNAAGMDVSKLGMPKFYFEPEANSIWGPDTVALLAPGSVKFIGRNKYKGSFAGLKGGSFFGTLPFPVQEFGCNQDSCLRELVLDIQLKYIDCPTEVEGPDGPFTANRGWLVILSKQYALWVQPTDAYEDDDILAGTNGTLKYFITNTSSDAESYAYGS